MTENLEGRKTLPAVKLLNAELFQKKTLLAHGCISEHLTPLVVAAGAE